MNLHKTEAVAAEEHSKFLYKVKSCNCYFYRVTSVVASSTPKPLPERCNECLKYMNDPDLKLFPGDSEDAVSVSLKHKFI
jgi:hypothetical protein